MRLDRTKVRGWLVAGFAGVLLGCGGESVSPPPAPPPPPPPPPAGPTVATVAVLPGQAKLLPAGTVLLAATPKTAAGDPVSGKVITWTTSNSAVATVSAGGLVTAAAGGEATITAAVDGQTGVSRVTVVGPGDNVQEETARAVSDTIGITGGALAVTSSVGVKYTLTVPAGALRAPTRITMAPVSAIQISPFAQLAGAVDLQPSGLEFAKPATLAIEGPVPGDTSLRLVGFSYHGDADSLAPALARDSARVIRIPIRHFSGAGAGFTTTGGMLAFLGTPGLSANSQTYVNQLVALGQDALANVGPMFDVMRAWMANVIVPLLQNATTDIQLAFAVAEYNWWRDTNVAGLVTGTAITLQPQRDAAGQAAVPRLKQAIAGNNQVCLANDDLGAAAGALYWQTVAVDFGVATAGNQLDRATVLDQLCIKIILTVLDYPNPITAGTAGTLDVRAAIKFGTDPQVADRAMAWKVTTQGSTADGSSQGLSDPFGRFFRTITPTGNGALVVGVEACLFAAEVPYADVCGSGLVVRQFVIQWTFDNDLEGWTPIGNAIRRSADGREVARLDEGGAIARTVAVPAGTTTFEFEISAHNRPSVVTHFTVQVDGTTILDGNKTSPATGGFSFSIVTASIAAFAGRTATIRIQQFPQNHGQLYIDRITLR